MSRRNKAGRARDRDALSRKTGLRRAQLCGTVLRHDIRGMVCATNQAMHTRQAWESAQ